MRNNRLAASIGMITGVAVGAMITPPAMFLAAASGGAGHGRYVLARLLYPYSMLLTRLASDTISTPLIALALAQFPLYGAIIGLEFSRPRSRGTLVCAIVACHLLVAGACFSGLIPNFS
jgi:hypothetical protein